MFSTTSDLLFFLSTATSVILLSPLARETDSVFQESPSRPTVPVFPLLDDQERLFTPAGSTTNPSKATESWLEAYQSSEVGLVTCISGPILSGGFLFLR